MSVTPPSFRRSLRGPAALAVLVAAASLSGVPAHASARVPMHQCWVNDIAAPPGNQVNGTAGDDHIFCDSDLEGVTVSGGAGNDMIEVRGLVIDSAILGGEGNDVIRAKHLVPQTTFSMVRGNRGNDIIKVATVHGEGAERGAVVHGDDGDDTITTGSVFGAPGQFNRGGGIVTGNDGKDTIRTGIIDFSGRVLGGSENDKIEAAALGPESGGLIQAGPGDDTIQGHDGAVLIVGEHWGSVDAGVGKDTCTVKSVSTRTSISSCEVLPKGSVTQKPAGKPQNPAAPATAAKPAEQAGKPAQQAAAPAQQTGKPAQQAGMPAEQAAAPVQQTGKPAQQAGMPAEQAGMPMEQAGMPAGMPVEHAGMPVEQIGMPVEQAGMPVEQAGPAQPAGKPGE
ncbi:hypothetical protein [Streptomyces sp. NPDC127114]|uniref:hypothetical protein n=1 Tax=Streptomyces sp. NPDC127114 TaxID=3345366 RepID=UPI00362B3B00